MKKKRAYAPTDKSGDGVKPATGPKEALAKVSIYEVAKRPGYEMMTRAGPDRPVYVGSREWRE